MTLLDYLNDVIARAATTSFIMKATLAVIAWATVLALLLFLFDRYKHRPTPEQQRLEDEEQARALAEWELRRSMEQDIVQARKGVHDPDNWDFEKGAPR